MTAGVASLQGAILFLLGGLASAAFRECDPGQEQAEAHIPAYTPVLDLDDRDRIAVYMYNIGGVQSTSRGASLIPEVPVDMDAYYVVEGPTWKTFSDHSNGLLEQWRAKGWQVQPLSKAKGSNSTSQDRMTGKLAKFTPSAGILEGHSWVVSFDANVFVNLYKVRDFLDKHTDSPLVLLDWRHWTGDYAVTGYRCLVDEMESMMEDAPNELITTNSSLRNCERWLASVRSMRNHVARDNDLFPHYYDLSIMFRNLRHPVAASVDDAFQGVAQICEYMERDRFVMPSFLKEHGLTAEVDLVRVGDLEQNLDHCIVTPPAKLPDDEPHFLLRLPGGNTSLLKQAGGNASLLKQSGGNASSLVKQSGGNASSLVKQSYANTSSVLKQSAGNTSSFVKQPTGNISSVLKQSGGNTSPVLSHPGGNNSFLLRGAAPVKKTPVKKINA